MNDDEIRTAYIEELLKVAPDLGAENIGDESHLQNDLGLDSMDILNFVTALHERLGVSIPEIDYPRIATVQEARAYLARRLPETCGGWEVIQKAAATAQRSR